MQEIREWLDEDQRYVLYAMAGRTLRLPQSSSPRPPGAWITDTDGNRCSGSYGIGQLGNVRHTHILPSAEKLPALTKAEFARQGYSRAYAFEPSAPAKPAIQES